MSTVSSFFGSFWGFATVCLLAVVASITLFARDMRMSGWMLPSLDRFFRIYCYSGGVEIEVRSWRLRYHTQDGRMRKETEEFEEHLAKLLGSPDVRGLRVYEHNYVTDKWEHFRDFGQVPPAEGAPEG